MENRLSKFERVRILGQRAEQISMGAPPLVDIKGLTDALSIAEREFKDRKIPFIIERTYPDGSIRKMKLSDMEY
jgi:DNA-directed RNA polymerase I, II, and III subunit RPABC2